MPHDENLDKPITNLFEGADRFLKDVELMGKVLTDLKEF